MADIDFHYTSDFSEAEKDIDRLRSGLDMRTRLHLAAMLAEQFLTTQQMVHVRTGSLRASGSFEIEEFSAHAWEGFIQYGGPYRRPAIPGPTRTRRPPWFYAYWEKRRDGDHNFLFDLEHGHLHEAHGPIIEEWLRGTT